MMPNGVCSSSRLEMRAIYCPNSVVVNYYNSCGGSGARGYYSNTTNNNSNNNNNNNVEGTTYNHGRPEGISERLAFYEPVSRYATGMSALRTQIHGIIPRGSSLPTSPDPAP